MVRMSWQQIPSSFYMVNNIRSYTLEADWPGNRGWELRPHPLFPGIFLLDCVSPKLFQYSTER